MNSYIRHRLIRIPYKEQLTTKEWKDIRKSIIKRDEYKCTCCGNGSTDKSPLNVHHKYYIYDKKAWSYPDSALITLCQACHHTFHKNNIVKVYTDSTCRFEMHYTPCKRCYGTGYLPQYDYVDGGICYRCMGARFEELIPDELKQLQNDNIENQSKATLAPMFDIRPYVLPNTCTIDWDFFAYFNYSPSNEEYNNANTLVIPGNVCKVDFGWNPAHIFEHFEAIKINGFNPPIIDAFKENVFIKNKISLIVPKEAEERYRSHELYKDFSHIQTFSSLSSPESRKKAHEEWESIYQNVDDYHPYLTEWDYPDIPTYCELVGLAFEKAYFSDSRQEMYVPLASNLQKVAKLEFELDPCGALFYGDQWINPYFPDNIKTLRDSCLKDYLVRINSDEIDFKENVFVIYRGL